MPVTTVIKNLFVILLNGRERYELKSIYHVTGDGL